MYLPPFEIHSPTRLSDAVALRGELGDDAALYAGGTELLLAMKMGVLAYDHLIDLKAVEGLDEIRLVEGALEIGATVTHHRIQHSDVVAACLPAMAALARDVANVRVRVAGTLAGNLAFAEPHADPPTLLTALGGRVRLVGGAGARELPLDEFLVGAYETALGDDEIVAAVIVPIPQAAMRVRYLRFKVLERPTVGVAAVGRVRGAAFGGAPTVVVGAVDETPRTVVLEQLAGAELADAGSIAAATQKVQEAIDPVDDLSGSADYKRHLAQVLARRAIEQMSEGVVG